MVLRYFWCGFAIILFQPVLLWSYHGSPFLQTLGTGDWLQNVRIDATLLRFH